MGLRQKLKQMSQARRAHPRMLFNVSGILLMIIDVGMGFETFSDPTPLKRLLVSFLMGLLVVDVAALIRQARRIRLVESWAERTYAQEAAKIGVVLHNTSGSDALLRLTLDSRGQPSQWAWAFPHRNTTAHLHSAQSLARGVHPFPDLLFEIQSPLRLFCARWVPHLAVEDGPHEAVLVWPAPWLASIPTLHSESEKAGEHEPTAPVCPTFEPEAGERVQNTPGAHGWLREWRRGDRLAHIAHKASAHRDQLLVQTASTQPHDDQPDLLLTLTWALSVTDSLENALSLLGTMAERGLAQGQRVGLLLEHSLVPTARGENQRRVLLDALARVNWIPS